MLYQGYVARPLRRVWMEDAFIGRRAVELRIRRLEVELAQVEDAIRYWNPDSSSMKTRMSRFLPSSLCRIQSRKTGWYTRSLEIKKEIVEIDNQLSHLDLFWLDEQRRTIEGVEKEIETLRGKQSSTVERQGQLKEQIHQLEYVTLPEQCQKLTELEDRISEEFTAEYQEQVGLPRYKQELARLKRPEAVQKNFSEQLIRSRNEQQTTWSELAWGKKQLCRQV